MTDRGGGDVLGVVLAGGLATRMGGGDKCLLDLAPGRTLLDEVLARLGPQVDALALNANGDPARFADTGLPVVPDSIDGFAGPLAGVLAGLDHAAEKGFGRIITVAGDTPFFPRDLANRLIGTGNRLALAATPDPRRGVSRHPTFGLWPVALREDLREALGAGLRKVVLWTDAHGAATVMFGDQPAPDPDPFFNVNTPQDLDLARGRVAAARATGEAI